MIHLHSFHLYNSKYDILNILPLSNLRILSIVIFENSDQISKITYLRISNCPLEQLFKSAPLLKYLHIENISPIFNATKTLNCYSTIYLKQLINVTNLTLSYEIIMKKSCLLFC